MTVTIRTNDDWSIFPDANDVGDDGVWLTITHQTGYARFKISSIMSYQVEDA